MNASIDNNGTFSVEDGTTVGTGTINESDKKYTVTYTNRAVTQQVYIQKCVYIYPYTHIHIQKHNGKINHNFKTFPYRGRVIHVDGQG